MVVVWASQGVGEMTRNLRATARQTVDAAMSAVHTEHELIMTTAKELTPVAIPGVTVPVHYPGHPGSLRASGHVQPPVLEGGTIVSRGGFGGPSAPYAVYVHEDPDARHVIGQYKFYESALLQGAAGLADRIAAEIKGRIGA